MNYFASLSSFASKICPPTSSDDENSSGDDLEIEEHTSGAPWGSSLLESVKFGASVIKNGVCDIVRHPNTPYWTGAFMVGMAAQLADDIDGIKVCAGIL